MTDIDDSSVLEHVLDGVADGIVVVNNDGRIVWASERACSMFGYERFELVGELAELLVPDRYRRHHERLRHRYVTSPELRDMGTGLELEGRRKDGTPFVIDIRLEPLRTDGLVVASIRPLGPSAADDELMELRQREATLQALLDTVTQHLFAIGMSLSTLERHASQPGFTDRVNSLADLLDRTIELTRAAQHLHPLVGSPPGL